MLLTTVRKWALKLEFTLLAKIIIIKPYNFLLIFGEIYGIMTMKILEKTGVEYYDTRAEIQN